VTLSRRFCLFAFVCALTGPMLIVGLDDEPPTCEEHGQGDG
jgi:hypothetical protein